MNQYDGKKGTAVSLLTHYFEQVYSAVGLQWHSDNDSEIESIVDAIIASAQDTEIRSHD